MTRRDFFKNGIVLGGTVLGYAALMRPVTAPAVGSTPLLRPPGALPEEEFLSRCIQCLRCVDVCPNHAIMTMPDAADRRLQSTPVIKPRRQACMLCNRIDGDYLRCTRACPTGALQMVKKEPEEIQRMVKVGTAEIDTDLCYSYNNYVCGTCYRACPFPGTAMTLDLWEKPTVHAEACVGCGLCERACILYPQAIRVKPVS